METDIHYESLYLYSMVGFHAGFGYALDIQNEG
jgi:hypothetical protein